MQLPTERTRQTPDPRAIKMMIYGKPGVGKTSFAASLVNPIILDTEEGARFIDCHRQPIRKWSDLTGTLNTLYAGDHGFRTVVIDTVDRLRDLSIEAHNGGNWPTRIDQWGKVNSPIADLLKRLLLSPFAVVLVSHERVQEFDQGGQVVPVATKNKPANTVDRATPTLTGSAWDAAQKYTDLIGRAHMRGSSRLLTFVPDERTTAKDRTGILSGDPIQLTYASFREPFAHAAKQAQEHSQ